MGGLPFEGPKVPPEDIFDVDGILSRDGTVLQEVFVNVSNKIPDLGTSDKDLYFTG
jgi:hypothetical protein